MPDSYFKMNNNVKLQEVSGVTTVYADQSSYAGPNHTFTVKAVNQPISGATNSTKDNATSDQLAIYNGSTKLWGINESGFILNPNKPCFAASWKYVATQFHDEYLNSDGSKTGWTARLNPQNDFNATDGIYTAPVSGTYFFTFHDNMYRTAGPGAHYMDWHKNDVHINYSRMYGYSADTNTWENLSGHLLCSLSAGDTMRLRVYNYVRLDGDTYSLFTGHLIE